MAAVTVTTVNGMEFVVAVNILIPVQSVLVSPPSKDLIIGQSYRFISTVYPFNADNQVVRWESSNPSVASVEHSGLVTAHSAGTAEIRVISECGGRVASAVVRVREPVPVPVVNERYRMPPLRARYWIMRASQPVDPFFPQVRYDRYCISIDLERTSNEQMQREVFRIRDEYFGRERWNRANLEERKGILIEFFEMIQPVMNISGTIDIQFFDEPGRIMGRFARRQRGFPNHTILVNEHHISPEFIIGRWEDAFDTIIHELRHVYQYEVAHGEANHAIVFPQTAGVWRENFKDSIPPQPLRDAYNLQPIEFDAFMFTREIGRLRNSEQNSGRRPAYTGGWRWPLT